MWRRVTSKSGKKLQTDDATTRPNLPSVCLFSAIDFGSIVETSEVTLLMPVWTIFLFRISIIRRDVSTATTYSHSGQEFLRQLTCSTAKVQNTRLTYVGDKGQHSPLPGSKCKIRIHLDIRFTVPIFGEFIPRVRGHTLLMNLEKEKRHRGFRLVTAPSMPPNGLAHWRQIYRTFSDTVVASPDHYSCKNRDRKRAVSRPAAGAATC